MSCIVLIAVVIMNFVFFILRTFLSGNTLYNSVPLYTIGVSYDCSVDDDCDSLTHSLTVWLLMRIKSGLKRKDRYKKY